MLTIIYLEGKPAAAVRFKSGAAELIGPTNSAMSQTMVTLARAKHGRLSIMTHVIREQVNNPAIEKFINHREDIPTNEPHHRIDENGLTSIPLQVDGEEMLEP